MSLFTSLYTSVSGLNAQAQALSIISDNIANSSTMGFKASAVSFSNLVASAGGSSDGSPGGVTATATQNIDKEGLLQQTQSPTDLAISGNGFFVVQPTTTPGQGPLYSRAGSFTENNQGYLVNTSGLYLMGWKLGPNGALPASTDSVQSLQAVNLNAVSVALDPTKNASINLNLNSADAPAVAPAVNYSRTLQVYDSLGAQQTLTLNFTKSASNTWNLDVVGGTPAVTIPQAITFNTDGTMATPSPATITVAGIDWGNGSDPTQSIDFDISKISQNSAPYNVLSANQDGEPFGTRNGVSVDKSGVVSATYTNGQTIPIFQLPLATFTSDTGLSAQSGGSYAETLASGGYNLDIPGSGNSGTITPSSLEQSNVDLATEFSNMIATQQAYASNAKLITAVNQMLQELLQAQA